MRESLLKDVVFPHRFGMPAEFGKMVVSMVNNGYWNGHTVRLDAGIRMSNLCAHTL